MQLQPFVSEPGDGGLNVDSAKPLPLNSATGSRPAHNIMRGGNSVGDSGTIIVKVILGDRPAHVCRLVNSCNGESQAIHIKVPQLFVYIDLNCLQLDIHKCIPGSFSLWGVHKLNGSGICFAPMDQLNEIPTVLPFSFSNGENVGMTGQVDGVKSSEAA